MAPPPDPLFAVGVGTALFNALHKFVNNPLLAVTTSAVGAAVGEGQGEGRGAGAAGRGLQSAASSALLLSVAAGAGVSAALLALAPAMARAAGLGEGTYALGQAVRFLGVRAAGAAVTSAMLVSQGVFRGLGDTVTPLRATVAANVVNLALDPLLVFGAGLGVAGAALATVVGQGVALAWMLRRLLRRLRLRAADLVAADLGALAGLLGPTRLLVARTLATVGTFTLATSLAAQIGTEYAAAHQVLVQLWLGASLTADALAVAAQGLMSQHLARGDAGHAARVAGETLRLGAWLGLGLAAAVGLAAPLVPGAFSADPAVRAVVRLVMPVVALTQPLNSMAFALDGVLYGASGFRQSVGVLAASAAPAVAVMLSAGALGLRGDAAMLAVWAGLATLMGLRGAIIAAMLRARAAPFERLPRAAVAA